MEQPQVNPKQPGTVLNGHGDGPEQHESHFGNFWTKKKPPGSNLAASIMVVPELLGQGYDNLLDSRGTGAREGDRITLPGPGRGLAGIGAGLGAQQVGSPFEGEHD